MEFADETEARIVQGQLKAEGIKSFLKNADLISAMPHMVFGFGGYQLQVSSEDRERAILMFYGL